MTRTFWTERNQGFDCSGKHVCWKVDRDRPDLGLRMDLVSGQGVPAPDSLGHSDSQPRETRSWGLSQLAPATFSPSDTLVRSGDLFLRYEELPQLPIEFSQVFRARSLAADPVAWDEVECALSMQTSLLDAAPYREFTLEFPTGTVEVIPLRQNTVDRAPEGTPLALGWYRDSPSAMVVREPRGVHLLVGFPGDWKSIGVELDGAGVRACVTLQVENLEKGVIRRLRSLWAFAPHATADQISQKIESFQMSKLPLAF